MTETILTHDAGVSAFDSAGGVVTTDDDDGVSFQWDEEHIVRVDAPADLEGAFDTDRFYKVEDATIARPIKQPYLVGDDIEWYKKPADELRQAAWSFDNKPFTLGHPDTGMVKDVDDIHGFWRNAHYVDDEDRLNADLYVPVNDQAALDWLEEHSDVSVGFYNRVHTDYDGDTGDLTDDDVDGFQVDMYGNHVAGVERGRCSGEDGCGLDSQDHGEVVNMEGNHTHQTMAGNDDITTDGSNLGQILDTLVTGVSENSDLTRSELISDMANEADVSERTIQRYISGDIQCPPASRIEAMASALDVSAAAFMSALMQDGCDITSDELEYAADAPSGIFVADGTWFAVGPNEHTKDSTEYAEDAMFPVDSCADVEDAWNPRGHTDNLTIDKSTLANRIQRVAEAKNCDNIPTESGDNSTVELDAVEGYHPWNGSDSATEDCGCGETMTDGNTDDGQDFDIPDLSIDALAEKNDAVQELKEARDSLREDLDEMKSEIEDAFDSAEHFSVELEEDECPCEAVDDLVSDLDEKVAEVEDLRDELSEYREDEIEDRLDTLEDLGADRDEWEETADEADNPLDVLDEEIERREEVLEAADENMSVKDIDSTTDEDEDEDDNRTVGGSRTFGRGHGA